jgi:predicted permease
MLDAVLQAVQAVAVILALILTGYFLSKRKVFTENTDKLLTSVLSYTLIPAMAFSNVTEYITLDLLQNAGTDLLIPFSALVTTFVLGQIIARLLKLPRSRRGVFCVAFGFSNSILIGLPITTSLFYFGAPA